jgi:hypothetical protein
LPPGGDIFREAKEKMAMAALTFDLDYPLDDEDRAVLDAGHKLDEEFDSHEVEKYKVPTDLVRGKLCHSAEGHVLVRVTATIRAPINQCLGHFRSHNQQYLDAINLDSSSIIINCGFDHSPRRSYAVYQYKSPFPFVDREFIVRCAWEKLGDGSFYFSGISWHHPDYPESPAFVRVRVARSAKLVAVSPTQTEVTVTSEVNLGGNIPRAINDAITIPKLAGTATKMMDYFACVRAPDAYNAGDSRELGKLTFLKLYKLKGRPGELRVAVTKMIARNVAMTTFQAKYNFLHEILCTIMKNKVFDLGSSKVASTALALTGSDATSIANTFSLLLLSNVTSDAAVDEWILTFPALQELDGEFPWFKPMMEGIAASLLAETSFGAKFRAYFGAALSLLDTATDSYVINNMMNSGRTLLAMALLAMVGANIFVQLGVTIFQNRAIERKNSKWMMLRECLFVVTFVKPGVDAHRSASGQEQLPGAIFSPMEEQNYGKVSELFTEALPGMCLQCIAFVTSKEKSGAALFSILISAGCAALTSTAIAYDMDTTPAKRRESPDMYGMIPDTGRGVAYTVMFSMAALQVLAKGLSVALLGLTSVSWLVYYLVGDVSLFLLYKVLRQDFVYFAPLPSGAAVPVSIVARVAVKVITDFTGCMHFRVPYEMGGAYFSFSMASSLISVPIISYLYHEYAVVEEGGAEKFGADVLRGVSIAMLVAWVILFVFFVTRVIVPKYRRVFWSIQTGWQKAESAFLDNEEDEKRILIFTDSIVLWSGIKEDVKAWTISSWETWDREKPEWFTSKVVASVPDEFIPPRFLTKVGGVRERRGSAARNVRESFRREGGEETTESESSTSGEKK